MRFVEYRDYLLRHADPRFRQNQLWQDLANTVTEAIEARKRGEDVIIPPPDEEEDRAFMDEKLRNTPLAEKLVGPLLEDSKRHDGNATNHRFSE